MGNYSSFVVRLWVNSKGIMKRGQVKHVATQKETYFLNFSKMVDFMNENLESSLYDSAESLHKSERDTLEDE